jgi:hypothetical protein
VVNVSGPASYNANPEDVVFCTTTGGSVTVTLPLSSANKSAEVEVVKVTSDSNAVTVANQIGDLTNGSTPWTISFGRSAMDVIADGGTSWNIV